MTDQAKQEQVPEVVEITEVDQFARVFHVWHSRMLDRLRNLRDIPFGTEVTMTDSDGHETKVKLKGDGMQGFQVALNTAISPNAALQQAIDAAKQIQHV